MSITLDTDKSSASAFAAQTLSQNQTTPMTVSRKSIRFQNE